MDRRGMEKFGTQNISEKRSLSTFTVGDRWWRQTAKQAGTSTSKNVIYMLCEGVTWGRRVSVVGMPPASMARGISGTLHSSLICSKHHTRPNIVHYGKHALIRGAMLSR